MQVSRVLFKEASGKVQSFGNVSESLIGGDVTELNFAENVGTGMTKLSTCMQVACVRSVKIHQ